eukprot:738460-Amphidinium_carterae.1
MDRSNSFAPRALHAVVPQGVCANTTSLRPPQLLAAAAPFRHHMRGQDSQPLTETIKTTNLVPRQADNSSR